MQRKIESELEHAAAVAFKATMPTMHPPDIRCESIPKHDR